MWHIRRTGEMHTAFEWEDMQAKGPFGRCTCKWEDNMKMDLQEMR
jgi:hypothetical protein